MQRQIAVAKRHLRAIDVTFLIIAEFTGIISLLFNLGDSKRSTIPSTNTGPGV